MHILTSYTHYMYDKADPRTIKWALTSPLFVVLIVSLYLYFILKAGPLFMKNRQAFDLRSTIQVYNLIQVIYCCALIYRTVIHGWKRRSAILGCQPVDYSDNPEAVSLAETIWWCYVLKMMELIETVFFVLRKKNNQISTLHLYHHVSTYVFTWAGLRYVAGGMSAFPMVLNCVIHIFMYTYYFLATLGPDWQKTLAKWKPKLTMLQMIQFCMILLNGLFVFQDNCTFPKLAGMTFIPNILLVFYMFYDFYNKSYLTSKLPKTN